MFIQLLNDFNIVKLRFINKNITNKSEYVITLNTNLTSLNTASDILNHELYVYPRSLTNSSYYPTSSIYRCGQCVYLRCSGYTSKEIPANSELTINVSFSSLDEGNLLCPLSPYIIYTPISYSAILRISIDTNGKITYTSNTTIPNNTGINLHVSYMTGKNTFNQ